MYIYNTIKQTHIMEKTFLAATSSSFVYAPTKDIAIEKLLKELQYGGVKYAKFCGVADVTHVEDGLSIDHSDIIQFKVEDGEILKTELVEINFTAS